MKKHEKKAFDLMKKGKAGSWNVYRGKYLITNPENSVVFYVDIPVNETQQINPPHGYLPEAYEKAIETNSILAKPSYDANEKGLVMLYNPTGARAYVQKKYLNYFPAKASFYVSGPQKPVIVTMQKGCYNEIIGLIFPVNHNPKNENIA